jgi:hypothetical protein
MLRQLRNPTVFDTDYQRELALWRMIGVQSNQGSNVNLPETFTMVVRPNVTPCVARKFVRIRCI